MKMKMLGAAVFLAGLAVLGIVAGLVGVVREVLARRRIRREDDETDMLERMVLLGNAPARFGRVDFASPALHRDTRDFTDCGACGADFGPSSTHPWHYPDEDCRAVREPTESPHSPMGD